MIVILRKEAAFRVQDISSVKFQKFHNKRRHQNFQSSIEETKGVHASSFYHLHWQVNSPSAELCPLEPDAATALWYSTSQTVGGCTRHLALPSFALATLRQRVFFVSTLIATASASVSPALEASSMNALSSPDFTL
mmetsp:Transcript_40208/g.54688  ORF Transcript_40208/g.54688 Transcript_40208/m.54688 type:complete len:136 (-) Transcript_40208:827-1234(-)